VPWLFENCGTKELWLPNQKEVLDLLQKEDAVAAFGRAGLQYEYVARKSRNPLYSATCKVNHLFKLDPKEVKDNDQQCDLYLDKERPFIRVLKRGR
jgi:hypothetical protein